MATIQHASSTNHYNLVEHNNNNPLNLKHISIHEQLEEALDYNHHHESPRRSSVTDSFSPSASSSPSHEFSFSICSLQTPPSTTTSDDKNGPKESIITNSSSSSSGTTAIDLSPADDIFFHGHLLPLHFLSGGRLSVSPRSSTNSLDSFTLPITKFSNASSNDASSFDETPQDSRVIDSMEKPKSRSFSLFRSPPTTGKSRKPQKSQETEENKSSKPLHDSQHHDQKQNHLNNNKTKFDLGNAVKRYAKLVRPLLIFKQGSSASRNNSDGRNQLRGQNFSYSGNLSPKNNKQGAEVVRGRFSAPASMRTSPTNSSMFLEASRSNNSSSNSDSTMEELQAAIQAAIAHCKNSSIAAAAKDKI